MVIFLIVFPKSFHYSCRLQSRWEHKCVWCVNVMVSPCLSVLLECSHWYLGRSSDSKILLLWLVWWFLPAFPYWWSAATDILAEALVQRFFFSLHLELMLLLPEIRRKAYLVEPLSRHIIESCFETCGLWWECLLRHTFHHVVVTLPLLGRELLIWNP